MDSFEKLKSFWSGKKILVTGHTGFKGAWLSELLLLLGADVTGYALEPPTEPSLFRILRLEERMRSVEGDVRDEAHLLGVFRAIEPEFAVHMAAQPIVRTSYKEPVLTYMTNVMGTVHFLEAVRQTETVRSVVNVTTDKVYENRELSRGFTEDERLDGYDPYSNSKSCSELVTHSYIRSFLAERGVAVSTARAGNVIGGGDFAVDRIIPDCVRALEKKEPVVLRNPASVRPFQHVLEPLSVYLMIAAAQWEDKDKAGAYNVGPDLSDCVTTGQLTELFREAAGDGFRYETRPDGGPHEAGFLRLDCTKLKETFSWKPGTSIQDAVRMTVEWTKEYLSGADMIAVTDRQIRSFFS